MDDDRVVVIGSGPCGAMAAATLAWRGVRVLLLDAGVRAPKGLVVHAAGNTLARRMGWAEYSTDRLDPASATDVDWISSLSLGGLSNYWTAAVPRFAPADFTDGARLDERFAWPIDYDDLVPYYEQAERALTITAGDPITGVPPNAARFRRRLPADWRQLAAAAQRHGHGVGALPMAKGRPWMAARRGTEFSSYHCIIAPLLASPGFELVAGAHVVRLNWSGDRVSSVTYVDRTTRSLANAPGRAVVVAAGAIDSTVLLLRSTSADFPSGLGNTNGLVGRYLHDHPREWWTATPDRPLSALAHPVYVARTPHADAAPLMGSSITLGLAARKERLRTYYRGRSRTFGAQVFGTMVPTDELGVALPPGAGPDDSALRPRISLRYDAATVANAVAARERLRALFASAGIGLAVPGPFHELRPGSSVHYGGSVRMHVNPEFGVLDGWNRVHDAPNVDVADSSCFTTGPEKNPTLTAMAIAARAADRLATDLLEGAL
jgi:choline dehydrogenase-like flavoprotein